MQSGGQSPGKRYRFNPPPGWPAYPPEWVPPPGWQPDPRWPPAPPGWPFWSEIEPPKPRRRLVRAIQIGAAVITFTATVVGLAIAIEGRPKAVRLADWTPKANAACEKAFGDILQPILTALPQMSQEYAAMQAGSTDTDRVSRIAQQMGTIAGAFRKLTADLEGIEAPKGDTTIPKFIQTGRDISTGFGALASMFTDFAMGKADTASMTNGAQAMQNLFGTSMTDWSRLSDQLKLDQCKLFAATGTSGSSPSPSAGPVTTGPGQLTRAEQALVTRIKAGVLVQCVPSPANEVGDVVAAVNCRTAQPGPTKQPLVMQFSGVSGMNQWMSQRGNGITTAAGAQCPDGGYNARWTSSVTNNQRAGQLVCQQVSADDFQIVWSLDSGNVVVIADGSDADSLYQWWTSNAYLIASS